MFSTYLSDLWSYWLSMMSSVVALSFAVWESTRSDPRSKIRPPLWLAAGVLAGMYAGYCAWERQYKRAEETAQRFMVLQQLTPAQVDRLKTTLGSRTPGLVGLSVYSPDRRTLVGVVAQLNKVFTDSGWRVYGLASQSTESEINWRGTGHGVRVLVADRQTGEYSSVTQALQDAGIPFIQYDVVPWRGDLPKIAVAIQVGELEFRP